MRLNFIQPTFKGFRIEIGIWGLGLEIVIEDRALGLRSGIANWQLDQVLGLGIGN